MRWRWRTGSSSTALTGEAQIGWGPYTVIALLVSIALARAVIIFGDILCFFLSRFTMETLLRRNLLAHILDQPGSQALPASPGEAVSRFRGDVEAISEFMVFSPFKLAHLIYIPVALFVMVQVNALITTVVFLPLLVIVTAVRDRLAAAPAVPGSQSRGNRERDGVHRRAVPHGRGGQAHECRGARHGPVRSTQQDAAAHDHQRPHVERHSELDFR